VGPLGGIGDEPPAGGAIGGAHRVGGARPVQQRERGAAVGDVTDDAIDVGSFT
jgi:hypothetical protein